MFLITCALKQYASKMTSNFKCTLLNSVLNSRYYSNAAKNYYSVLGIQPECTDDEVKEAYYSMSKLYHPDKNMGNEAASHKILEINEAFEILGNKTSREEYNKKLFPALQIEKSKPTGKIYDHPEYYNPSIYEKKIIRKPNQINCTYEQYKKHLKGEAKRKKKHLMQRYNYDKYIGAKTHSKFFFK